MKIEELKRSLKVITNFSNLIVEYSGSSFDRALETAIYCMQKVIDQQEVDNEI